MADTPNHNYNVPDQGDQDWHQPLNENFEEFEVDIELRDQESNLGDYTPTDGAKFLATDTGVVYLGDGSNWNVAFVAAEYDDSAGTATISQTLVTSELEVGTISGSLTGGTSLNNIAGNNLSIDSNGTLNASGGGGGGGGISNLNGGEGIDPANIGDGDTLSVAWGDANDLDGSGNVTGGNWTPNNNLLEPADSNIDGIDVDEVNAKALRTGSDALGFIVNGSNALTLTEEAGGDAGNVIAGNSSNSLSPGTSGATISGGGKGGDPNRVKANYGTIGGGYANEASGLNATVGGGLANVASGNGATVGGGDSNEASASSATVGGGAGNEASASNVTVGGGVLNEASATNATVGGGLANVASGDNATVPGGGENRATQPTSFAAGSQANAINEGAFVWADATQGAVESTGKNQFLVAASGGTGIGLSDPATTFHVADDRTRTGSTDLSRPVAVVENTSGDPQGDMLGLKTRVDDPGTQTDFISFIGGSQQLGQVQGDGNGGLRIATTTKLELAAGGATKAEFSGGNVLIDDDLNVNGDVNADNKNFVETVATDDGQKEVVYTSTEAPTARTEATGVAKLEDGRAEIELPEHFGWVTDDDEPIYVQTTPHSADSGGLAAVERTSDRLVIEDRDGDGDYEFSYTVKGTRDGYADKEVVREPTARDSAKPSQSASPADD
ncbi:hypothetical protein BRD08_08465 [Halobacteriales archaeon SW_10_66_29]|nr:MAG: hypothetical protein BRD08_08465 [Halobacteriales archaeon SW_10_66_29]